MLKPPNSGVEWLRKHDAQSGRDYWENTSNSEDWFWSQQDVFRGAVEKVRQRIRLESRLMKLQLASKSEANRDDRERQMPEQQHLEDSSEEPRAAAASMQGVQEGGAERKAPLKARHSFIGKRGNSSLYDECGLSINKFTTSHKWVERTMWLDEETLWM